MAFITKSLRFDDSHPVLKDFVAKQSNFSKAMKYLVFDYCSKHPEIEDLAVKYQVVSDAAVLDRMRAMTQTDSAQEAQPEVKAEEKTEATPAQQKKKASKKEKKKSSDVNLDDYSEYM